MRQALGGDLRKAPLTVIATATKGNPSKITKTRKLPPPLLDEKLEELEEKPRQKSSDDKKKSEQRKRPGQQRGRQKGLMTPVVTVTVTIIDLDALSLPKSRS